MENKSGNPNNWPGVRSTNGGLLQNGVVLELVQASSGDGVELLRWEGGHYEIGPQFQDEDGTIYTAGYVHSSVLSATRLPRQPADYGDPGKLLSKISDLFRRCMGFSRDQGVFFARVAVASWFPDLSPRPLTVCITGLTMDQIMKLFRLLHIFCRRPLTVAALTPDLPFSLGPTLLGNLPRVSTHVGSFWRATNYPDVMIPGPKGTVRNVACGKIIFCETEAARKVWAPEAVFVPLVPTAEELSSLSQQEERQLASEFQSQLLMFRLRTLTEMYQSTGVFCPPKDPGFAPGGYLPSCIAEDPEIQKALAPLLEVHEEDLLTSRSLNPDVAIVESIWDPMHNQREISTSEITKRVNALLRDRGETAQYNSREIGWKLRNLGLPRRHNGKGKALRFCRETRRRVHDLAAQFKLKLPTVADCDDCKAGK